MLQKITTKIAHTSAWIGAFVMLNMIFPLQAFAQGANRCSAPFGSGDGISGVLNFPTCIINRYLVPIAISLEVVLFIGGIITYMANADDVGKRTEGRQFMIWGILAIFVTLSLWGLVAIIRNTLQI